MYEPLKEGPRTLVKDLPHARTDNFLSAYVSNTGLVASFFDVTLMFGKVAVDAKGEASIEDSAFITMSWEHARALSDGLKKAIDDYEKEHGAIRKQAQ